MVFYNFAAAMKWVYRILLLLCFLVLSGYSIKHTRLSESGLISAVSVSQHTTKNTEKLRATEVDDDDDDQGTSSRKGLNISNYFTPAFFSIQPAGYFSCFSVNSGTCLFSPTPDKYIVNRVIRT